jgi:hypothetical protein
MSAESQNYEASRENRCWGTALQTRLLLGDSFVSKQQNQSHR